MAAGNSPEGKVWEKAHSKLVELRQESSSLTLDMVLRLQVVKLDENHLASIESRTTADTGEAASSTANVAAVGSMEQQIAMQATTITDLEQKLEEYSARSAQARDSPGGFMRQGHGGRVGENTYGKRKVVTPTPPSVKFRKDDKGGKKFGDRVPPTCSTRICGKLHRGTCLMERDLDKEQRDLDNAKRHKENISKMPMEAKYVQHVRELESECSNEDGSTYLASPLVLQTLRTPHLPLAGTVVVAMRDPCLDSGSPVDITGVAALGLARSTSMCKRRSDIYCNALCTSI